MNSKTLKTNRVNDLLGRLDKMFAKIILNKKRTADYFEPFISTVIPNWSPRNHLARVCDLREENDQVYTLILKTPSSWKSFKAGHNISLSIELDGSKLSRFFSISSSPNQFEQTGLIEITIKIQKDGKVTPKLREILKPGSIIEITGASGDFYLRHDESPLLMIAGGSGITPLKSMIQQINSQNQTRKVDLLYYADTKEAHLFSKEFNSISKNHQNINIQLIASNIEGFFSAEHLEKYCPDFAEKQVYLCGPPLMMNGVKRILGQNKVSMDQVLWENFGPVDLDPAAKGISGRVFLNKETKLLENKSEKALSILELIENNDLNPQSGCRMGICKQCTCIKESGRVLNKKTGEISGPGEENIQICVSIPVGDVYLNFEN